MLKRNGKPIAVIDCETDPFVYERVPKPFIWGYYNGDEYHEFTNTEKLVAFLSGRKEIVYAHNGGKFDFHFFSDYIEPFRKISIINQRLVMLNIGKCQLRDSFSIIPTALASYEKMKFDYSKLEKSVRHKHMRAIRKYLKSDCVNLYGLVTAFVQRYGLKLTIASTAMAEFKRIHKLKSDDIKTSRYFYGQFQHFYFGGRVQCFKVGDFRQTTYTYDINSAYPYAMMHKHPIGQLVKCSSPLNRNDIRGEDFYVIRAKPNGIFPERGDNLSFSEDTQRGKITYFITGYELLAGIKTRTIGEYDLCSRYRFSKCISFQQFVSYYYSQKQKSDKHSTEYIFAKLMLNSLYGKFASNPDNYRDWQLIPIEFIRAAGQIDNFMFCGEFGDKLAIMARPLRDEEGVWYNIATAASITGFVRGYLWQAIAKLRAQGEEVFYCDTDSIITTGKLSTSTKLGAWKLESVNDRTIIIAPKLYGTRDATTHKWKIASKGVELDSRELMQLAKGKMVEYKRDAPTFSLYEKPRFIDRTIKGLEKIAI